MPKGTVKGGHKFTPEERRKIIAEYLSRPPKTPGWRQHICKKYNFSEPLLTYWKNVHPEEFETAEAVKADVVAPTDDDFKPKKKRSGGHRAPRRFHITPTDMLRRVHDRIERGEYLKVACAAEDVGPSAYIRWRKTLGLPGLPGLRESRATYKGAAAGATDALIATTNRALQKVNGNGNGHGELSALQERPAKIVQKFLLMMRAHYGIELSSLVTQDGECTVTYKTTETFKL